MCRRLVEILLIASLYAAPFMAWALSSDRDAPIRISADRVEFDEKRGISRYIGAVRMAQGSLHVTADSITVNRGEKELERVRAEGRPATFRQRPDGAEADIEGQARQIEYSTQSATVVLEGDALIRQGKDEFRGDRIQYNMDRGVVQAAGEPGAGRVQAIIHPKQREGQ